MIWGFVFFKFDRDYFSFYVNIKFLSKYLQTNIYHIFFFEPIILLLNEVRKTMNLTDWLNTIGYLYLCHYLVIVFFLFFFKHNGWLLSFVIWVAGGALKTDRWTDILSFSVIIYFFVLFRDYLQERLDRYNI